jgi:hypothetical protein
MTRSQLFKIVVPVCWCLFALSIYLVSVFPFILAILLYLIANNLNDKQQNQSERGASPPEGTEGAESEPHAENAENAEP